VSLLKLKWYITISVVVVELIYLNIYVPGKDPTPVMRRGLGNYIFWYHVAASFIAGLTTPT